MANVASVAVQADNNKELLAVFIDVMHEMRDIRMFVFVFIGESIR